MQLGIYEIIYIVLGVCALVYILLFVVLKVHNKKEKIEKTGIDEKHNVRYTAEEQPVVVTNTTTGAEEVNVTYERQDILLKRGFKYIVGDKNKIKAGKYTLLSSEEGIKDFNIRRNGYVRTYEHNSSVVLAEGDDLTPINISVILR